MGVGQYWYLAQGVMNVVSCLLSSSSSTWWNPQWASTTVLNDLGGMSDTMSKGVGMWWVSLRQHTFNFWKSTNLCGFPNFLGTTTILAHHSVASLAGTGRSMPAITSSSNCLFTSAPQCLGMEVGVWQVEGFVLSLRCMWCGAPVIMRSGRLSVLNVVDENCCRSCCSRQGTFSSNSLCDTVVNHGGGVSSTSLHRAAARGMGLGKPSGTNLRSMQAAWDRYRRSTASMKYTSCTVCRSGNLMRHIAVSAYLRYMWERSCMPARRCNITGLRPRVGRCPVPATHTCTPVSATAAVTCDTCVAYGVTSTPIVGWSITAAVEATITPLMLTSVSVCLSLVVSALDLQTLAMWPILPHFLLVRVRP